MRWSLIGGDGFTERRRGALASEGIPVIGIPASIDNDILGHQHGDWCGYGHDTIIDAVDKLRDTASSHGRTFLVETWTQRLRLPGRHAEDSLWALRWVLISKCRVTMDESGRGP